MTVHSSNVGGNCTDTTTKRSSLQLECGEDNNNGIDFESAGGKLVSFDDGHVPETFRSSSNTNKNNANNITPTDCQLVLYPHHQTSRVNTSTDATAALHVYDNVLPQELIEALYDITCDDGDSPWGTYVTLEEAKNVRTNGFESNGKPLPVTIGTSEIEKEARRRLLSIQAVSYFLQRAMSSSSSSSSSPDKGPLHPPPTFETHTSSSPLFSSWEELESQHKVHGVAVWALASNVSSRVQYHLDYAELIRYEHNVIVPPLYAGTIHCSPTRDTSHNNNNNNNDNNNNMMKGGDFCVNVEGLSHYARHGYKGRRSGDEWGGWTQPQPAWSEQQPTTERQVCWDRESNWVSIPYQCNRMNVHEGHLPHLSTPIEHLPAGQKRTILGFNIFANDIGPLVQQAPEHSHAFRRRIHLQRALLQKQKATEAHHPAGIGDPTTGSSTRTTFSASGAATSRNMISLEKIRSSKGFTKLLVLAKRERVKQALLESQCQLDKDTDAVLKVAGRKGVTLSTIMEKYGNTDGATWPNAVDVQMHVNRRVDSGSCCIRYLLDDGEDSPVLSSSSNKKNRVANSILPPTAILYLE